MVTRNKHCATIDIMTCKYVDVDENGKTVKEYELDRPWYEEDDRLYWSSYNNIRGLEYFLVGTDENGVKWSVKDVKFMDKDGNVVFEYVVFEYN